MGKLTDSQIKNAKPKEKSYLLTDGGGLRLMINHKGGKTWLFNYYKPYTKERTNLTLGVYPQMSLQEARAKHRELRALLADNIDPVERARQQQQQAIEAQLRTFEVMARAWFDWRKTRDNFTERTAKDTWALFERHILPIFGGYPLHQISANSVIDGLEPLHSAGKLATVRKIYTNMRQVFIFAHNRNLISTNPLLYISKEFDTAQTKHNAYLELDKIQPFFAKFYELYFTRKAFGFPVFAMALLTFQTASRPSEVAGAKWSDIDLIARKWAYPVQKGNKNLPQGRIHTVTLTRQAVHILFAIKRFYAITQPSYAGAFVFPSNTKTGHANSESLCAKIRQHYGRDVLTHHGIRSTISTALNDKSYNADWIEKSLSHKDKNKVRSSYNHANYIDQRAEMLQVWADLLDTLLPKPIEHTL